ncbi:class I SAM-dependent DNA methyltransferase [Hyalangium versicolor]|uniref:class I SAM-dependent DNA methyltransferase n=1 Tax=Hyalangium versicolor TaxID=2861190 RepID=UPI001CCE532E|nr:class I SAM-dependent methyltransferase [Hyalangium versicolor]
MIDFSRYDRRRYPTVSARDGYEMWAPTYEATVLDLMDLHLARRLRSIEWTHMARCLDLACGTGRAGAWLKAQGVGVIDGVDLTPAMLERARSRGVYDRLWEGDVTAIDLPEAEASYDLVTQFLADEHLADLAPLYREAARLTHGKGRFVLVGYHPWFLMAGIPTHFDASPGHSVAIQSHVHLFSDHVASAGATGWRLTEMVEGLVDDAWVQAKPKWEAYRDRPVSFAMAWEKR